MAGQELKKTLRLRHGIVAAVAALLLLLMVLVMNDLFHARGLGPAQPIPFSHRVHVTDKWISCYMCHELAMKTARAGIPPVERCMLCHSRIIITYPHVVNLRRHYYEKEPILWHRVNWVPEFVYFDHSVHIQRGIDCSRCHGNVAQMDRVAAAQEFQMGFCMECHRRMGASIDCFTCHR